MPKKSPCRLYVVDHGPEMRWTLANSRNAATYVLGDDCRAPDPDDLRNFWNISGIADMTDAERMEKFNVSRQTVHNWRTKGGSDLQRRKEKVAQERDARIREVLTATPNLSASMAAQYAHARLANVKRIAKEMGLTLARNRKLPSNEDIVKAATGRTWREIADALGVRLQTLRSYVYKDKALAEAVRAVRKSIPTGTPAHGSLPIKKIRMMGNKGMTAYAISEALKLEHMTVRAHLRKMAQEKADAEAKRASRQRKAGNPVDGSDGAVVG